MECDPSCEVEVRVLLPDGGHACVNIRRNSSTSLLFALLARKLNMSRDMALSCAIFETMEQSFGTYHLFFHLFPKFSSVPKKLLRLHF